MRVSDLARCPNCAVTDWPYHPTKAGVERCGCTRGRAFAHADANRGRPRNNVSGVAPEIAAVAVQQLTALLNHYGALSSDIARLAVSTELCEFVCYERELWWLVHQLPLRYRGNWPGILEVRALYCSKFAPRDGVLVDSAVYENGVRTDEAHLIADSPRSGAGLVSAGADSLLAQVMADATPIDNIPPQNKPLGLPSVRTKPPLPTQEEIDRIKEQQRYNQERSKARVESPDGGEVAKRPSAPAGLETRSTTSG